MSLWPSCRSVRVSFRSDLRFRTRRVRSSERNTLNARTTRPTRAWRPLRSPARPATVRLVCSPVPVFVGELRETGGRPLPLIGSEGPSVAHPFQYAPSAASDRRLRTVSARSPWHSSGPCSSMARFARCKADRVARSWRNHRRSRHHRPTTVLNRSTGNDSFS